MSFKYSCFLSYRHAGEIMTNFAAQIERALEAELSLLLDDYKTLPVFKDDRQLEVSDLIDPLISEAVCKSVCMIILYTPNYLSKQKRYCASELEGMLRIEASRKKIVGAAASKSGLIFTVVLRKGAEKNGGVPKSLNARQTINDFSDFAAYSTEIQRDPKLGKKIREIAQKIKQHCDLFLQHPECCADCDNFELLNIDTDKDKLDEFITLIQDGENYTPAFNPS
jgi:hypothetical protein